MLDPDCPTMTLAAMSSILRAHRRARTWDGSITAAAQTLRESGFTPLECRQHAAEAVAIVRADASVIESIAEGLMLALLVVVWIAYWVATPGGMG